MLYRFFKFSKFPANCNRNMICNDLSISIPFNVVIDYEKL